MVKLDYLDPFEVHRLTSPLIMPQNNNNRKKYILYSVIAPSVAQELQFLAATKTPVFRGLYRYFIPKRWQVTLYGRGNIVIKPNEEGDVTQLFKKYGSSPNLKNIDGISSYLPSITNPPHGDFNTLLEVNHIVDTIINNPKDHRAVLVKSNQLVKELFDFIGSATSVGSYIGTFNAKYTLIPTKFWFTDEELKNPELLFKRNTRNYMGQIFQVLQNKGMLQKLGTVVLVDGDIVLKISAEALEALDSKEQKDAVHDALVSYMKRVYRVRNRIMDTDTPPEIRQHLDDEEKKDLAKADANMVKMTAAEKKTTSDEVADQIMTKAKIDPDTATTKQKDAIAATAAKITEQPNADQMEKTKPALTSVKVAIDAHDGQDITYKSGDSPLVDDGDIKLSEKETDTIIAAQSEGRSVASQKRNEMLRTKYKDLKMGSTTLGEIEATEAHYEIPETKVRAHVINKSLKTNKSRQLERAYNENLAQQDLLSILLHFSKVRPALYLNKDIQIVDASTKTDRLIKVTAEFEDENRKRHHLSFLLPKMYQDRYFYLNDQKMNLTHQKLPYPVIKTAPDRCQLVTNYNKVFSERYGVNLSPRTTKLKKLLAGSKCPKSIKVERGDATAPNKGYLTTVEFDDLGSVMTRIDMLNKSGNMLTIYFIVNDAFVVDTGKAPTKITRVKADEEGNKVTEEVEDDSLFLFAVEKVNRGTIFARYYLSGITNRVADQNGKDLGELSDFIVNKAIEVSPEVEKEFADTSVGSRFVYCRSKIMDEFIPTILVASASDPGGLTAVLDAAKINYSFQEKRPTVNKDITGVIPFSDGYLIYDRYPYENSLLMNGLLIVPTKEYSFYDMGVRDTYIEIFDTLYGRRTLIDGIENFHYMMVDPITKDILVRLNMPTDFTSLLLYCVGTLADNTFQTDASYENSRVRSNEIVLAYLYRELALAWAQWKSERADSFSIRDNAIIKSLLQAEIVDPHSKLNVTLEQESDNQIKLKGPSGMNEEHSFTMEKRAYHPTGKGIVAVNSIASGEVGIARHLATNANIEDSRGFVTLSKDDYDGSELLSAGEMLQTFGVESADMERVAMAIAQSKHTIPVQSQSPGLVSYDMERTIPYISNDFAVTSKKPGKVVAIENDVMILQYDDGTYDDVDLSAHPDKNTDGGFFVMNQMTTEFKVGQRFAENEILAYDKKYISDKDMLGDPSADVGCLARIMVCTNGGVFEDSGFMTDSLAHRMAAKITRPKRVVLSKFANIKYMVKVGQEVKANDPLLTFDDTEDEFSSQLLASIAQEQDDDEEIIATNAPVLSKVTGTVKDIFIYYTVPLEELTPSMRKIIEAYNKDHSKKEKTIAKYMPVSDANTIVRPTEQLAPDTNGKIKGVKVGDGVIIDIYVEYLDVIAPGDKVSSFSALKSIMSFIVPDELAPYTDFNPERKVDMALAAFGVYKRMCLDLVKVGGLTKFLVEMKRLHKNAYHERVRAELNKLTSKK